MAQFRTQLMDYEDQKEMWRRMDMHKARKRAERKAEIITFIVAVLIIAFMAWFIGSLP